MSVGVVVSCYRQERFLARTVAALERALDGEDWLGVLEFATPSDGPPPPLSARWRVISSFDPATGRSLRPLTPGAGRMAGLAACERDWVLFVDSDVEIERSWMQAALALAAREPRLGGIGGRLEEWFVDGALECPGNPDMYRTGATDHAVDYLAAVAFYRRAALAAAGGYDPRLNSDEDFELALRFHRRGLELRALGRLAGRHWSAPRPSFRELGRRWATGLCFGPGQVLRLYLGRPGFGTLVRRHWLYLAALGLWTLGAIALVGAALLRDARLLGLWALAPLAVIVVMGVRKRSLRLALHSLLTWSLHGAGLVVGWFRLPAAAPSLPGPVVGTRGREAPC